MTVNLSPLAGAGQQFLDDSGNVLTGGKLYSYAAGTTTPQTTYTIASGATAHSNPIILNAAGRVATGEIWLTSGINYKFVLYTSTDVLIASWDNITGINGTGIATNATNVEYDPPFIGAVTSGYTVSDKLEQTVSVKDFGAVGDGVTDDYAAIMAAINSFTTGTGFYVSGPAIYFPPGTYYCSQTIELKKSVRLYGDHSGMQSTSMATLLFPPGVTGIIVQRYNTIGNGTESPPTTAGDASTIERLQIRGQFGTADSTGGHGIWLRARAALRQLTVSNFTGNGVHIVASATGAPSVLGNANLFVLDTLTLLRNGGWGAFIDGADVNAGVANAVNVASNGLGGLYDGSFLGNTHIAHHASANGAASSGYNTTLGKTSLVSFGGNRYYGANNATEASLVATTPGTDDAVWTSSGAGGVGPTHLLWVAGQPEGTYFSSAQYKTDSANARNVFIGCYSEGGYSPSFFVRPTLTLGGSIDAIGGAYLTSSLQSTVMPGIFQPETISLGYLAPSRSSGNFISFPDTSASNFSWTLEKIVGRVGWSWANLGTPGFVSFYDRTATIANGYARDLSTANGALGIGTHYFGGSTQMKLRGLASAIPTTGTYLQGDILYDLTPTAGGSIGWVCTTAGTPGTWKTFGAISA